MRLVFDPEAIPEHPGAQLASYGTPLVDRLLADAVNRGRHVVLYLVGLEPRASRAGGSASPRGHTACRFRAEARSLPARCTFPRLYSGSRRPS